MQELAFHPALLMIGMVGRSECVEDNRSLGSATGLNGKEVWEK